MYMHSFTYMQQHIFHTQLMLFIRVQKIPKYFAFLFWNLNKCFSRNQEKYN